MFEPPGSRSPAVPHATPVAAGRAAASLEPGLGVVLHVLVWKTGAMGRAIDAIWDEAPETLAMLADWGDALGAMRRDLVALRRAQGAGRGGGSACGRIGHEAVRAAALAVSTAGRVARLLANGHRLLHLQAEAASATADPGRRTLLDRHRARTARHVNRLDAWTLQLPRG